MCMDVTEKNELRPFVAPVNHNFLNEAKTLNIARRFQHIPNTGAKLTFGKIRIRVG